MTAPAKSAEQLVDRTLNDNERLRAEVQRLRMEQSELLAICEMFTAAAHDARDALNHAGIPCPSSIALAAEKARAAIASSTVA